MPRRATTEGSGTGPSAMLRSQHAEATRRAVPAAREGRRADQMVPRVNASVDAALDEEMQRIALIDAPAVLGLEPEGSVDQHPGHVDLRSFIAASTARGQIIDIDPDLLTHLIRGLVWLSGLQIAHASDPDVTRSALGEALDAMLRGLAPGTKR